MQDAPCQFVYDGVADPEIVDAISDVSSIFESDWKTVVDFMFDTNSDCVTSFGSLRDGSYQLLIDASLVTDRGVPLDGNGDGLAGDDFEFSAVDGFFRKYGDISGDGSVRLNDFGTFRGAFGSRLGEPSYLDGFDANGDQLIGLTDFADFRINFGRRA